MKKNLNDCFLFKESSVKIFRIMKLTMLFAVIGFLHASANSYSQNARITLDLKNAELKEVISEIQKQTEFIFFYSPEDVNEVKNLNVKVEEVKLQEILDECFKNTEMGYEIKHKAIVLKKVQKEYESTVTSEKKIEQPQTKIITGKVTDSKGGPLPGVTIIAKGTTLGIITDFDGNYSIEIPYDAQVLSFSFIGMKTQDVSIGNQTTINVTLEEDLVGIEEVVAIGYGVQKKSVVTGAISGTNAEELENQPIYRVDQAMQGRVSGVTIASSSGQPGASSTVRVRGTTSINSSDPLYVVDGTPITGSIDYLNQNDIESIEVLKDAASAAIYGARSAAGVILITTKKGEKGAPRFSYNGYYGLQGPANQLDLLDAEKYATLYNEMLVNSGKTPEFDNPGSLGKGTDWQEEVFSNNAVIQNHDMSISGGNERVSYYTSFGYFEQEGIILPEISNYNRYNVRANMDYQLADWMKIGENISYSFSKQQNIEGNSNASGVLAQVTGIDPITPVIETDPSKINMPPYSTGMVPKDENGNYYALPYYSDYYTNPFSLAESQKGFSKRHNVIGNFYVELTPIKNLILKSSLGVGGVFSGAEAYQPVAYYNASTIYSEDIYRVNKGTYFSWNIENTASYSFNINKHHFVALAGMGNYVDNISQLVGVSYYNIPVDNIDDASLNWAVGNANIIGEGYEGNRHKVNSIYGRLIYDFDEKYLFTGIIRRDGSSRFGPNNKFGYFPSVSLGWVVSKENFWGENIVDFLKIRGSYGETGSDNIGDFKYVSVIQGNRNYTIGDQLYLGNTPEAIANPDLRWEATTQLNIGVDATFLNNFRLTVDLFDKRTKDMLMTIDVPAYSGAGDPTGNVASMKNTGIEFELSYQKSLAILT